MSRKIHPEVAQAFPTLNRHGQYKLCILKDRRDYLVSKNEGRNDPNHYDLAEIGALNFAIGYIQKAEKKRNTPTVRLWSALVSLVKTKNPPLDKIASL